MERLRLLESVVVNANDAGLITEAEPVDLPGPRIVYCNAAFTKTTGYTEAEILGRTPRLLQSADTDRKALDKLRLALTRWQPVEVELLNRRKDGTEFWVELSIVPVANEKGWFTHWVSVQRDVSDRKASEEAAVRARIAEAENIALAAEIQERKRVEAQLLYSAFHDDLTKLRNRAFLMDRLKVVIDRMRHDPGFQCAVLFMDLDRFKLVNDSLGHRAGDLLLMEVAQRLRTCIRPQDTLARVGGDEFALIVEGLDGMDTVVAFAQRIIQTMRRPLWIGKQEVFSSCSVGVVQATQHHQQPEELLRDADIAMYEAKRNDTGGYAVFAGSMHDGAVETLELRTDLQNAVARAEFFLEYQPVCDSFTGRIVSLEALIRWRHPVRGLIPPLAFIGMAEETGLIREIGRWVLREASTRMSIWRERFPGLDLTLNVNTSGEELKDRRFTSGVRDTLSATGLDPKALQIEVTESIFLQSPELVGTILNGVRALGVRIALDDFGMGYSSLSYLDRYQMDTIKIDRSFVAGMLARQRTMAIVETIVKLGHALDMDIVAEGVENEAQLHALQAKGCHLVQGYHLGRPLSVDNVEAALARHLPDAMQ
jgi:diguanylate cyclase (GGDEF)-like protein/PAS domain S-box-containing protein